MLGALKQPPQLRRLENKRQGVFPQGREKQMNLRGLLVLTEAYKEIFKDENLTTNLKNLKEEFRKNDLVNDVVKFLEKDKKRPICTPFSK